MNERLVEVLDRGGRAACPTKLWFFDCRPFAFGKSVLARRHDVP